MLDVVASRLAAYLSDDSNEQEVCAYGIEILISNGLLFISIFAISVVLDQFLISVYFTALFALLRITLPGFHCKKYSHCYFFSMALYFVFLLTKVLMQTIAESNCIVALVLTAITTVLFVIYCRNNTCGNSGKICFFIYFLWNLALTTFGESSAAYPILYCMMATVALLYFKKNERRQME